WTCGNVEPVAEAGRLSGALTYRPPALTAMRLYGPVRAKSRRHGAGASVPSQARAGGGPQPLCSGGRPGAPARLLRAAGRPGHRGGPLRALQPARAFAARAPARPGGRGGRGQPGPLRHLPEGPGSRAARAGRRRPFGGPQDAQAGRGLLWPREILRRRRGGAPRRQPAGGPPGAHGLRRGRGHLRPPARGLCDRPARGPGEPAAGRPAAGRRGLAGAMSRAWTTQLRLGELARGPLTVRLEPDAAERAKLAHDVGLETIAALTAELTLKPWLDGVEITGRFEATVEQICAVSLDPFEHRLAGEIDVRAVPAGSPHAPDPGDG